MKDATGEVVYPASAFLKTDDGKQVKSCEYDLGTECLQSVELANFDQSSDYVGDKSPSLAVTRRLLYATGNAFAVCLAKVSGPYAGGKRRALADTAEGVAASMLTGVQNPR